MPELNTPVIVIDEDQTLKNIKKEAALIQEAGCSLRPHIKTHKDPYWAKKQLEAGAVGITVAKLGEAEVMAEGGIDDIFMAYPLIGPEKIQRAIKLSRKIRRFIISTDSLTAAKTISSAAVSAGICFETRCEIDTGMRRTGIPYSSAPETIRSISQLPGLKVTGIFTFRGALLDGTPTHNLIAAGHQEGKMMVEMAKKLHCMGVDIRDVSAGSSPTGIACAQIPGVTEVRPGTYIYNDAMQIHYGRCTENECSALIAVTVVSRPSADLAIIDGGVKVFAADAPLMTPPYCFDRYGICVGHPGIRLTRLSEEHGMADLDPGEDPQIGDILYFIPNHICTSINLMDSVVLKHVDGSYEIIAVPARGKSR